MIKITFNKPTAICQDGILFECLFCFCFAIKKRPWDTVLYFSYNDIGNWDAVMNNNIKSIEHVKPTDL